MLGVALLLSPFASSAASVPRSARDIKPLLIGARVPTTTLRTPDGKAFDLGAAFAKRPTILIFYRGGWCPYCNAHLGQLQALEPKLLGLGYRILAVSPDRPEKLAQSVEKGRLGYTLLSDSAMAAAEAAIGPQPRAD